MSEDITARAREILALWMYRKEEGFDRPLPVDGWQAWLLEQYGDDADAQLAALTAAGITLAGPGEVVVDAGRFGRVTAAARSWDWKWRSFQKDRDAGIVFLPRRFRQPSGLQSGDLDPIAPGAATEGE